jgi:predicted transcriptional regulator
MTVLANKLALTTTEASRQLQRLTDALLTQKQPDGTYSITDYGRLILHLSSNLGFVHRHKEYFLTHDVWGLPEQFLPRLGELSGSRLSMDVMENVNTIGRIAREAKQYIWMGGVEQPLFVDQLLEKPIVNDVEGRLLLLQRFVPKVQSAQWVAQGFECRAVDDLAVNILMTEKEAGLSFLFVGGRADYAGFVGRDPKFIAFVRDLFLHYWERSKRV